MIERSHSMIASLESLCSLRQGEEPSMNSRRNQRAMGGHPFEMKRWYGKMSDVFKTEKLSVSPALI